MSVTPPLLGKRFDSEENTYSDFYYIVYIVNLFQYEKKGF